MRIISGTAGRLPIEVPKTSLRPSSDRLREALFSILGSQVDNARVLDLFAGSGALSLEALSRGAREAVLIEKNVQACRTIERNLVRTKLKERGTLWCQDVFTALPKLKGSFDLIFADPPYRKQASDRDYIDELLKEVDFANCVGSGLFIVEQMSRQGERPVPSGWELQQSRRYGKSELLFFSRNPDQ